MSKLQILSFLAVIGGTGIILAGTAQSQVGAKNHVLLQGVTPGASQSGHLHVSGTVKAGQFVGNGSGLTGLDASNVSTGIIAPSQGGLGIDTSNTASGSLLYAAGSGVWSELVGGNESQILGMVSGLPAWIDPPSIALPFENGGSTTSPSSLFTLHGTGTGDTATFDGDDGTVLRATSTAVSGLAYTGFFGNNSPDGRAIFSQNTATSGWGLAGRFGNFSPDGRTVYVTSAATTGDAVAVYAESNNSVSGTGIIGIGGRGIAGYSTGNWAGVYGYIENQPSFGFYGGVMGQYGNGEQNGVFAFGRLAATGTKSFVIDHPLDPAHKALYHYCAESPDPLNIYRGTVTTDSSGYATIQLPDYYSEINAEETYQLTVIDDGDDFVQAKVVRRQKDNQFTIRTSQGNITVDWRIEAKRNDRFVRAYGSPIEVEKTGADKGKYLYPQLYGRPLSEGVFTSKRHPEVKTSAKVK